MHMSRVHFILALVFVISLTFVRCGPSPQRCPSPTKIKKQPSKTPPNSPEQVTPSPPAPNLGPLDDIPSLVAFADKQITQTIKDAPRSRVPIYTNANGNWEFARIIDGSWTLGFFPACLWQMHNLTTSADNKQRYATAVADLLRQLTVQATNKQNHDLGFMIYLPFRPAYDNSEGNTKAGHLATLITAAGTLNSRYVKNAGMIRSWDNTAPSQKGQVRVIIDSIMNLELLFAASKLPGGKEVWYTNAEMHATKLVFTHVRADGTTFHVASVSDTDGSILAQHTRQGLRDNSTWSRGQAWAIAGFAMCYRETGIKPFLDTARRVADAYLARIPDDWIPPWDLDVPLPTWRDTSAAAAAASGFLEMSSLLAPSDRSAARTYYDAGVNTLKALSTPPYLASTRVERQPTTTPVADAPGGMYLRSILAHGAYSIMRNQMDEGLVWGDYYYLKALQQYKNMERP